MLSVANVVKLPKRRIDLRGDNRLPELLDERERLKAELKDLQDRLKEIDAEVHDKLGDAEQLITSGWLVKQTSYIRHEYTIPERMMRRVTIRRTSKGVSTKV
jgi:hypothetical protein